MLKYSKISNNSNLNLSIMLSWIKEYWIIWNNNKVKFKCIWISFMMLSGRRGLTIPLCSVCRIVECWHKKFWCYRRRVRLKVGKGWLLIPHINNYCYCIPHWTNSKQTLTEWTNLSLSHFLNSIQIKINCTMVIVKITIFMDMVSFDFL